MATARHTAGKEQRVREAERQQTLAKSVANYNKTVHPLRETLSEKERVFRLEVVETFLKACIALAKAVYLRPLLEKHATGMGSRSLLSQLIPVVLAKEKDTYSKSALFGQSSSIVLDGSMRLGEAVAVVARYVDHNWKIRQVLARLAVLSKSLTGDQAAAKLNDVISTTLQVRKHQIMAIIGHYEKWRLC